MPMLRVAHGCGAAAKLQMNSRESYSPCVHFGGSDPAGQDIEGQLAHAIDIYVSCLCRAAPALSRH
jgi:hypothetical protein